MHSRQRLQLQKKMLLPSSSISLSDCVVVSLVWSTLFVALEIHRRREIPCTSRQGLRVQTLLLVVGSSLEVEEVEYLAWVVVLAQAPHQVG